MEKKLNRCLQQGYQTGDLYIAGLLQIAETRSDGDLQKALDIALQNLHEQGADEHVTDVKEAFRWLQDHPGELRE